MPDKKERWQHTTPMQNPHDIVPVSALGNTVCKTCRKAVKRVDADDGPEGLKALLKF